MFSGIIELLGKVINIQPERGNITFTIQADFADELKIDQSIAHNGVCLTVVAINNNNSSYQVTAISETLQKTNLGHLVVGAYINLERCIRLQDRIDGHIVQGHVDTTGVCTSIEDQNGSWKFTFKHNKDFVTVEKGSVAVNGISLTVVDSKTESFSVCIIPYTYEHTNLHSIKVGDLVNLEFDILGKYIQKLMTNQGR
jgi:riboflavin synthase